MAETETDMVERSFDIDVTHIVGDKEGLVRFLTEKSDSTTLQRAIEARNRSVVAIEALDQFVIGGYDSDDDMRFMTTGDFVGEYPLLVEGEDVVPRPNVSGKDTIEQALIADSRRYMDMEDSSSESTMGYAYKLRRSMSAYATGLVKASFTQSTALDLIYDTSSESMRPSITPQLEGNAALLAVNARDRSDTLGDVASKIQEAIMALLVPRLEEAGYNMARE
tara:strand:- start:32 stop:697 length:666 start_codon:yes stop_codon:yes gene_type:complete